MALRVYIMPSIKLEVAGASLVVWPKYMSHSHISMRDNMKARYQCKPFGTDLYYLMFIETTDANHTILRAYPDVISFPANLDNILGADLTSTKASLNNLRIPTKQIQATDTWKRVIKIILNHTEVLRRVHHQAKLLIEMYTPDMLVIDLPDSIKAVITGFMSTHDASFTITATADVDDLFTTLAAYYNTPHTMMGVEY